MGTPEVATAQLAVTTQGFTQKDAFNAINYGLVLRNRSIALTAIDVSVTVTFSSRSDAQVATDEETITEVPPGCYFDVGGNAFSAISLAPAHMRVSLKVAGSTVQQMPLPTATARIQNVLPFAELTGEVHNPYRVPLPSGATIYMVYLNPRGKVLGGDNETTGAMITPGATVPFTDQLLSAISGPAVVRVSVDPDGFPTPGSGEVRWVPA